MKNFSTVAKVLIIILALITVAAVANLGYAIATSAPVMMPIGLVIFSGVVFGFTISTAIKEKQRKESEDAVDADDEDDEDF